MKRHGEQEALGEQEAWAQGPASEGGVGSGLRECTAVDGRSDIAAVGHGPSGHCGLRVAVGTSL